MSDTKTPRTDAVVRRYIGIDEISGKEMNELLDHARQLQHELGELQETNNTLHNLMASAERRTLEKVEHELAAERESQFKWKSAALSTALYRADCEVSTPDDYQRHQAEASCALIQRAEQAEARLAEAITIIRKADFPCTCGGTLSGIHDDEFCPIGTSRKFLSSTETPALLKEVEELRKRIHELQGVPFSDRNYGAMKDKLKIAREALEKIASR